MKGSLLLYNLKLNCLIFSADLNGSLILFIHTYTVNYRNALDRLRVRMNIILFVTNSAVKKPLKSPIEHSMSRVLGNEVSRIAS